MGYSCCRLLSVIETRTLASRVAVSPYGLPAQVTLDFLAVRWPGSRSKHPAQNREEIELILRHMTSLPFHCQSWRSGHVQEGMWDRKDGAKAKALAHKHEDSISDPQDLGRKPGVGACACDLNFRRRQISRT